MKKIFYNVSMVWLLIFLLYLILSLPFLVSYQAMGGFSSVLRYSVLAVAIVAILLLYRWFSKSKLVNGKKWFWISLIVIIVIQIGLVAILQIQPINDLLYLHDETITMIKTGNPVSLSHFTKYFSRSANNFGYMTVLYTWYSIMSKLGVSAQNLVYAGNALNILMIDAGVCFGYWLLKQLKGRRHANILMLLVMINPWTYLWVSYFYTHTASFFWLMFTAACIVKIGQLKDQRKRLVLGAFLGFITFWGIKIRVTNLILVIAIVLAIVVFFRKEHIVQKKNLQLAVVCVSGILVGGLFFQVAFGRLFPKENPGAFPVTHWLMMGSHGSGDFQWEDFKYTRQFPTVEEKQKATVNQIKKNYSNLGVMGTARLFGTKLRAAWLIGDDGASTMLYNTATHSKLQSFVTGAQLGWLLLYNYALRAIMFFFMFVNTLKLLKRPNFWNYICNLTILGAMVFHCIWEANAKYSICFMGLMFISMVLGMDDWKDRKELIKWKRQQVIPVSIIALVSVCMLNISYDYITAAKEEDDSKMLEKRVYSVCQNHASTKKTFDGQQGILLTQSFQARKPFDTVEVKVGRITGNVKLRLLDESKKEMACKTLEQDSEIYVDIFTLDKPVRPKGNETYYVEIVGETPDTHIEIPIYQTHSYDVYEYGYAKWRTNQPGKQAKDADIVLRVYMEAK